MKSVLQSRSSSLTVVREIPAPPCRPGDVLVRNAYSVISSGTERSRVELSGKSLLSKARERPDLVREVIARARKEGIASTRRAVQQRLQDETPVGYSSAGEVIEVGEHVRGISPGDRVACAGGGHANHAAVVAVPANLCVLVPDSVPLEQAAFATIASIALHGVRLAEVELGSNVVVIGCGLVGQLAVRLAVSAGASVIAIDVDPARVAQATAAGAAHGLTPDDDAAARVHTLTGSGADSVVVAAAAPVADPLVLAAKAARDRGNVVLVGAVPIEFPRPPLYDKELSFRVSRSYGPGRYDDEYEERGLDYPIGYVRWTEQRNMACVIDLIARGRLALDDLIDEVVPVDDAARAYQRLVADAEERPKGAIVLSYPDDGAVAANGNGAGPAETAVATAEPAVTAPRDGHAPRRGLGRTRPPRVGLIGPGSFARRMIVPALTEAGAQLAVVAGGSGPGAEAASRTGPFERFAESPEALIADPDVDVVVVCTRHGSHAELVTSALEAGKHVFCEKPLALTADELERVMTAARGAPGVLLVGFNRRFSPMLRRSRDHIAHAEGRRTILYRVAAGDLQDHWAHDLSEGGGRVLGEGCHFVDCARFLADSPIASVYATGYGPDERPVQARDRVVIALQFESGSVASIVYTAEGARELPKERCEVSAGPYTAVVDDYQRLDLLGPGAPRGEKLRAADKGHNAEIARYLAAVAEGRDLIPLDEIENVSLATLAAVESLRTGRPVRLS